MKKLTRSLSPVAALLVIAAITPDSVWASKCSTLNRKPASVEQINCLKEEKDKLESDMKKLVEDKQQILKELDELKDKKKDSSETKEAKKEDKKDDKKAESKKEEAASHDVVDVMFQMTSLMISQQQQQTLMMNQMFSMMNMQMQNFAYPKQSSWSNYVSPYAFDYKTLQASHNPYSLENLGKSFNVGLSANHDQRMNPYGAAEEHMMKTPYRYPAEQPVQLLDRQQLQINPRIDGFNFGGQSNDIPPSPLDAKPPVQMEKQQLLRT